jgi:hypothetical protein
MFYRQVQGINQTNKYLTVSKKIIYACLIGVLLFQMIIKSLKFD